MILLIRCGGNDVDVVPALAVIVMSHVLVRGCRQSVYYCRARVYCENHTASDGSDGSSNPALVGMSNFCFKPVHETYARFQSRLALQMKFKKV